MLTGRYAFRTGIGVQTVDTQQPLLTTETCLPRALLQGTANEYRTGCFGKWHLSTFLNRGNNHPNDVGFERFRGTMGNLERSKEGFFSWCLIDDGVERQSTVYATSQNVDDALDWILKQRQPWFCYVPFNAVHEPFHRPPEALYDTDLYVLPNLKPMGAESPVPYNKAALQAMDTEIGRLFAGIPQSVMANTVVIFFSDNGTSGPAIVPGYQIPTAHNKGSVYEDGINVPLIVMGPHVDTPGRQSTHLVNAVDFYYTVLDIAGADLAQVTAAGTVDSVSFWPACKDRFARTARSIGAAKGFSFSELFSPNGPNANATTAGNRAIRGDRYKVVIRGLGRMPHTTDPTYAAANGVSVVTIPEVDQFFDVHSDRHETSDLLFNNGDPTGVLSDADPLHPGELTAYNTLFAQYNALIASP